MPLDLHEATPRPDWVRRMISMGESVGGAHHLVPLDPDELIRLARKSTGGLSDFGDWDGDWRGRLESLLSAMEQTANLHAVGRLMVRQEVLRGLRTRLLLARTWNDDPSIAEEAIEEPLIITGPGRSGTSILFELLCLDPSGHGPLAWESSHPIAFAPEAERKAMAECEQEFWEDVNPIIGTIHEHRADLPVECIVVQIPSFSSAYWWIVANIPGWVPDMQASMQYHKAVLQTLQHGRPPFTWILKTPIYLMMLDLLYGTFPDAWVVRTHRDPLKTAPSGASTMAACRFQRSDQVDLSSLTPPDGSGSGGTHDQMLAVEQRMKAGELPDRFVDVHFSDLMANPVETVATAYQRVGRPFDPAHADAIVEYLARKPRGSKGSHHYRPEDWGFDPDAIRAASRAYMDAFCVSPED